MGHDSGGLPASAHTLLSALRAAAVVEEEGTLQVVAHRAYQHGQGSLFFPRHLQLGEDLLLRGGLLTVEDGVLRRTPPLTAVLSAPEKVRPTLLLALLVESAHPLWLSTAASGDVLLEHLIPSEEQRLLEEVVPNPSEREALLLALGRKHNAVLLEEIGMAGEEHVVVACQERLREGGRPDLAEMVFQVSTVSDQLGYDVTSPGFHGQTERMEVKTTTRVGPYVEVYLSRNECRAGLADPHWALVLCALSESGVVEILGWLRSTWLEGRLPADTDQKVRWESIKVGVPVADLQPGLPLGAPSQG